jgi:hypothetical protein
MPLKNLEGLMMKRQDFPIEKKVWGGEIIFETYYLRYLPPLHPDLGKNGLPMEPELGVSLVKEALDFTLQDINPAEISKDTYPRFWFHDRNYPKAKEEVDKAKIKYDYDSKIPCLTVYEIPLDIERVYIEPKALKGASMGAIRVNKPGSVNVPNRFSEEMLSEYGLEIRNKKVPFQPDKIEAYCPFTWYHHNVPVIDGVFYKNLIIAMNNWTVARKYGVLE